jgi:hypothetical protein
MLVGEARTEGWPEGQVLQRQGQRQAVLVRRRRGGRHDVLAVCDGMRRRAELVAVRAPPLPGPSAVTKTIGRRFSGRFEPLTSKLELGSSAWCVSSRPSSDRTMSSGFVMRAVPTSPANVAGAGAASAVAAPDRVSAATPRTVVIFRKHFTSGRRAPACSCSAGLGGASGALQVDVVPDDGVKPRFRANIDADLVALCAVNRSDRSDRPTSSGRPPRSTATGCAVRS